ncbi:Membrane protein CcdC involved in cytochrome C biogenesis [Seinonella peptonophila]|uniref:Membrane protein CcdC involved in cytochrome C biogenesis n=1 Tax=Seinonella peptonophila TaxID=112248 RepID=A0A1M4V9C0_9BACL|nr:cytochrome c biogenesis protein CcdC [Seinonella peptonophila]SHE65487.1 Membrane protein CcdC involved in cytochrome C biogenesis [Seinonella peptonophila]
MTTPFPLHPSFFVMIGFAVMAITIMIIRMRAAKKPATIKKILIPPLGMSTGFLMFLYQPFRLSISWAVIAFLSGALLLSVPLIMTSKFQIVDQDIYLKPSRAFTWILVVLLIVRLALHSYIEEFITIYQTGGLFFILAFGMLLPWRIAMYLRFRKVATQLAGQRSISTS